MTKKQIVVLYGGISNEREVSLRSGRCVANSLESAGYDVSLVDTSQPGFDLTSSCSKADAIVPMLHGVGGEDGSLQQQLDKLDIPYFGSGERACAQTFNKVICKELLSENGVLTPNWEVVDKRQFETSGLRHKSYVLKPIAGGSSIDVLIVHNPTHQLEDVSAVSKLFGRYKRMLLEELIEGRELTVSVFGEAALPVIMIVPPSGEEFDYNNKYNGQSQEIVRPTTLSQEVQSQAQRLTLQVHRLTGCRHVSRTDIIIAENGALYVLEINTIPGMTEQSLFPKAAAASGLTMKDVARRIVKMTEQV